MELEKQVELISLYDLYASLLTEHQRDVFESYYIDDLSLQEIAEIEKVSRNAVFSLIHRVEDILKDYESKLHLLEKSNKIIKVLEDNKVDSKVIEQVESIMED